MGKEEKERTSNKGQWRPLDFQERQFTVFFVVFFLFFANGPRGVCLPLLVPQEAALNKEQRSVWNQPEEAPSESCPTESPTNLTAFNTNPKPDWQGHCPGLKSTIDPKPAYHQYPKKSRIVAFLICKNVCFHKWLHSTWLRCVHTFTHLSLFVCADLPCYHKSELLKKKCLSFSGSDQKTAGLGDWRLCCFP